MEPGSAAPRARAGGGAPLHAPIREREWWWGGGWSVARDHGAKQPFLFRPRKDAPALFSANRNRAPSPRPAPGGKEPTGDATSSRAQPISDRA